MDKTFGLILLTYKGKALLMYKKSSPIDEIKNAWSFIAAIKNTKEPLVNTLIKVVEKEMGIKIDNVETITDTFYHARLSDDNVNQIKRDEDQLLDFFTPKDLEKLSLSQSTSQFISKYGSLI